jgi:hypothetical protein
MELWIGIPDIGLEGGLDSSGRVLLALKSFVLYSVGHGDGIYLLCCCSFIEMGVFACCFVRSLFNDAIQYNGSFNGYLSFVMPQLSDVRLVAWFARFFSRYFVYF